MRHKIGNSPKCKDCYYYTEKTEHDNCRHDGWCSNWHYDHGRKVSDKPHAVMWHECCSWWEDAEDRLTHYEVVMRKPEPTRKPLEAEHIKEILRGEAWKKAI